ncbi:MAG TPA: hypothetical protein PLM29_13885, partial [Deltaproteobacteria bacterium]|nr:hypothetical protein [Deltaproteobacteria bacterium]
MNKTAPAPDDLVEALLAKFPANDPTFTTDMEKRHRAFYKMKKKHPEIFKRFVFDLDREFPYCE